ncbi:hypothetical protein [Nocardia australiensis]|uniref:hypothetical protein n=1 Tax=Nocardia australiensis TaxID=2887191 RepID=UPI001D157136|nr:hypothetical protein [Nocardia australiensis]
MLRRATAWDATQGKRLPSLSVVIAFVDACRRVAEQDTLTIDESDFDTDLWQERWRRIALLSKDENATESSFPPSRGGSDTEENSVESTSANSEGVDQRDYDAHGEEMTLAGKGSAMATATETAPTDPYEAATFLINILAEDSNVHVDMIAVLRIMTVLAREQGVFDELSKDDGRDVVALVIIECLARGSASLFALAERVINGAYTTAGDRNQAELDNRRGHSGILRYENRETNSIAIIDVALLLEHAAKYERGEWAPGTEELYAAFRKAYMSVGRWTE